MYKKEGKREISLMEEVFIYKISWGFWKKSIILKSGLFLLLIFSMVNCSQSKDAGNVFLKVGNREIRLTQVKNAESLQNEVFAYIKKNWSSREKVKYSDWFQVYSIRNGGRKAVKEKMGLDIKNSVVFSSTRNTSIFRIKEKDNGKFVIEKRRKDGGIDEQCEAPTGEWSMIKAITKSPINLSILGSILRNIKE